MSADRQSMPKGAVREGNTGRAADEAEARLQCVIELAADFYWEQDAAHRFTVYRARDLANPDPFLQTIIGKTSWELGSGPPSEGGRWDRFRAALAARESFRNVVHVLHEPGGAHRHVSFSGQPIADPDGGFLGYRGIAQDVSLQVREERLGQLEHYVVRLLADTEEVSDSLHAVIGAICTSEGWSAGNFWAVDEKSGVLRLCVGWDAAGIGRHSVLHPDDAVPRWLDQEPVWISDVAADPRTSLTGLSELTGWHTGVVVPVRSGRELIGVLDFYAPGVTAPDPSFLRVLRTIAGEIGHFYQRAMAMERLRESEERFASTMEFAAIGIAHVDDSGRFLYVNPLLCRMLGYTERELLQLTVKDISHPGDVNVTDELRDELRLGTLQSFKIEKRYLRKDGTPIWVGLTVAAKRDKFDRRLFDVSIIEDISIRKSAEERVQYLATHDGLTGLPNRAMFSQLLGLAIETASRYDRKFAVLFIDLDRFKIINDSLGHEAGDVLLREVASRLRDCLRASDVVARLGGDEFVVLLQEVGDPAQVGTVARNILSAVMRPVVILGQECRVTASIGVCVHPAEGQDDQSLMKNADMAMYRAKEEGKNNYQFYSEAMQAHTAGRLALETNLRRALERDEFSLHYQAKVNFKTGAITGVEALLRWNSPDLGSVSPANFIPIAEETGLIVPIGRWVLRTACEQCVAWRQQGLPTVRVSVNLSMRQLNDDGLVNEIEAVLHETQMPPDQLELEVTESMIMHNSERAIRVLTAIKALGVRLAIDDFGTGYSSLAHLKRFPIDTLKVDRSFIREIPRDAEDRAITEAIIAMGRTLSLTIVAEGVETPEQQAFLSERACDEMQGYYFSTPVEACDFANLLRRHTPAPRL